MRFAPNRVGLLRFFVQQPRTPIRYAPGRWKLFAQQLVAAQSAVRGGARPAIVLRALHHSRSNRIAFDVTHRCPRVTGIEWTGEKASLPHMPTFPPPPIAAQSKRRVRIAKCVRERRFVFGDDNPVDVVAHQAIGPDLQTILLSRPIEELKIFEAVGILVKDVRAPISPLRDVVWKAGNDDASQARHEQKRMIRGGEGVCQCN